MLIYFGGKVMPPPTPTPQSPLFSVSFCSPLSTHLHPTSCTLGLPLCLLTETSGRVPWDSLFTRPPGDWLGGTQTRRWQTLRTQHVYFTALGAAKGSA